MKRALLILLFLAVPCLAASAEGHGEDASRAWARALEAAQMRIRDMLPEALRARQWSLDAPALSPALLRRTHAIEKAGAPEPSVMVDGKRLLVARYRVELTEVYLAEARRLARADVAQDRAWAAGLIVLWLLIALLVGVAYLRLEESTRGYASRLLRLAALMVLLLAALALWLLE